MSQDILLISDRGQITIPLAVRKQLKAKYLVCSLDAKGIHLHPLQTKDDFLEELDSAEKKWEKKGGKTLKQIKKIYQL